MGKEKKSKKGKSSKRASEDVGKSTSDGSPKKRSRRKDVDGDSEEKVSRTVPSLDDNDKKKDNNIGEQRGLRKRKKSKTIGGEQRSDDESVACKLPRTNNEPIIVKIEKDARETSAVSADQNDIRNDDTTGHKQKRKKLKTKTKIKKKLSSSAVSMETGGSGNKETFIEERSTQEKKKRSKSTESKKSGGRNGIKSDTTVIHQRKGKTKKSKSTSCQEETPVNEIEKDTEPVHRKTMYTDQNDVAIDDSRDDTNNLKKKQEKQKKTKSKKPQTEVKDSHLSVQISSDTSSSATHQGKKRIRNVIDKESSIDQPVNEIGKKVKKTSVDLGKGDTMKGRDVKQRSTKKARVDSPVIKSFVNIMTQDKPRDLPELESDMTDSSGEDDLVSVNSTEDLGVRVEDISSFITPL
ncbi:uncharacterized protein LOC144449033 [Glandiceps talaboti]